LQRSRSSRGPEGVPNQRVRRFRARGARPSRLPEGWKIVEADREGFSAGDHSLDVWGTFVEGPGGEVKVAVALTEAEAYRQLAAVLRGTLDVSDGWAPLVEKRQL
jgi:hypothetical protein